MKLTHILPAARLLSTHEGMRGVRTRTLTTWALYLYLMRSDRDTI